MGETPLSPRIAEELSAPRRGGPLLIYDRQRERWETAAFRLVMLGLLAGPVVGSLGGALIGFEPGDSRRAWLGMMFFGGLFGVFAGPLIQSLSVLVWLCLARLSPRWSATASVAVLTAVPAAASGAVALGISSLMDASPARTAVNVTIVVGGMVGLGLVLVPRCLIADPAPNPDSDPAPDPHPDAGER